MFILYVLTNNLFEVQSFRILNDRFNLNKNYLHILTSLPLLEDILKILNAIHWSSCNCVIRSWIISLWNHKKSIQNHKKALKILNEKSQFPLQDLKMIILNFFLPSRIWRYSREIFWKFSTQLNRNPPHIAC